MEGRTQHPDQQPHHEHEPRHEEESRGPKPRIYVASLADYVDGRLVGQWIDAGQEPDGIYQDIDEMLKTSPLPRAEEWAIHDYEGFGPFSLSEYESIDTVSLIGMGIAEHGPAFAHWIEHVGTEDTDTLNRFDEHYLGTWDSLAGYAEQLIEDLGVDLDKVVPNWLSPYLHIDYEQLGNDLASELYVSEDGGSVYVFEA